MMCVMKGKVKAEQENSVRTLLRVVSSLSRMNLIRVRSPYSVEEGKFMLIPSPGIAQLREQDTARSVGWLANTVVVVGISVRWCSYGRCSYGLDCVYSVQVLFCTLLCTAIKKYSVV